MAHLSNSEQNRIYQYILKEVMNRPKLPPAKVLDSIRLTLKHFQYADGCHRITHPVTGNIHLVPFEDSFLTPQKCSGIAVSSYPEISDAEKERMNYDPFFSRK